MKVHLILILALIFSTFEKENQTALQTEQKIENFEWLVGNWVKMNDREGFTTYEIWQKKSENEYLGKGYTLKGKDTVFEENLSLNKAEGNWNFVVSGVHAQPIPFNVISIEKNKFIAENLLNDFPKRFTYYLEDSVLNAKVSSDKKNILFQFKKVDQK
ncbi:MAG: hypothetical protein KJO51_07645 [Gramella sp.]|nr:hypothetical protein [Christiangramia sp.]